MAKISGVYGILNNNNGLVYIGSSNNIDGRWNRHRSRLNKNTHSNNYLQKAWNKYGEEAFEFFIFEECLEDDLITLEQFYVEYYCSYERDKGYNIAIVVDAPMRGRKQTIESRKKMSKANGGDKFKGENNPNYGNKYSKETREKLSKLNSGKNNPNYGKKLSEEAREKIAEAHRGTKLSEETKRKISEAKRGKKLTEEHKAKLRLYRHTDEAKKKMSEARKGKKLTEEHCRAISEGQRGKVVSEETKRKISKAMLGNTNRKV